MSRSAKFLGSQIAVQSSTTEEIAIRLWPCVEAEIFGAKVLSRREQLALALLCHMRLRDALAANKEALESNSGVRLQFCVDALTEMRAMVSTKSEISKLQQWLSSFIDACKVAVEPSNFGPTGYYH